MKRLNSLLTLVALIIISNLSAKAENRFFIDDFIMYTGETKELSINLTNDVAFTGFQADLYLPNGLEVVQEDGDYIFDLTDRKGSDHSISTERQDNGAIRLLCYSLKLKEFSGTSGALVKFSVKASDDFRGDFQINIKDITFSQKDLTEYNFTSSVTNIVGKTLAKSITIDKPAVSLKATETIALVATVLPETTTDKAVTWKSDNEAVATVDANGVVTAIAVGEANITATTTDGTNLSASCKVTVIPTLAETITLNQTAVSLKATETAELSVNILPATTTNKAVTWKSQNEAVATVDANGVVTAIAVGETTITVTTADGSNLSATCKVTVVPTPAASITLNTTAVTLKATETATLTTTILPATTTNKAVTWKSDNEAIATVDANGVVTAIAVGVANITATTTDGTNLSATCKVTVEQTFASSISLDKTSISLKATESETLKATILPATTTNQVVTWKSDNEAIATVDANGVVTAHEVGVATITATTTDGTNLSASCTVNVIHTQASSITLNMTEVSLKALETAELSVEILPATTTNKVVTWKSDNEAIATVDANGVVTAIAVGETTITATTTDGSNLSASCKVTVIPTLASSITLDKTEVSFKANETVTLTPTILPATTTNTVVVWTTTDEKVAIVDANGVVTAIGVGEATITATTTDGSNLSASCAITVLPTPGDVNNDAVINVTDVMTVASYILGRTVDVFIFEAADITEDSKINITDIVGIVNIILTNDDINEVSQQAQRAQQAYADGNSFYINDFSIQEGETKQIAINLTNNIAFSGFQADIRLPEGLELCEEDGDYMVFLSDRKGNDHVLTSALRSDGSVRLLSYSMNLNDFADSEGALVYLTVKAAEKFVGDYEISIDNIIFTQADLTEYSLQPTVCHLTGITGINGVDGEVAVATIGNDIVVKNAAVGSMVRVYAADGVMIASKSVTDGNAVVETPAKGIYVVVVDGKSYKVIVK